MGHVKLQISGYKFIFHMFSFQLYIKKEDLCFFKQSSDLSGRPGNDQLKEIDPNELFKKHIKDDDEARAKAEEDIKKHDPRK